MTRLSKFFLQMEQGRVESLLQLELKWYIAPSKSIKPTQSILKRPNKEILLSMVLDNGDVRYTNRHLVNQLLSQPHKDTSGH